LVREPKRGNPLRRLTIFPRNYGNSVRVLFAIGAGSEGFFAGVEIIEGSSAPVLHCVYRSYTVEGKES